MQDFPNAENKEWSGPGFHAAALKLFDAAACQNLFPDSLKVIDKLAENLTKTLNASLGKQAAWDPLFAWHIGQVITVWCELNSRYPSLLPLKAAINSYYAELTGTARNSGKDGWDNKGRLNQPEQIVFGTARALAAAYSMETDLSATVIRDAHDFIIRQMETPAMLQGLKGCVNILEALQMKMECKLPNAEIYLTLQIGARLTVMGLYKAVLDEEEQALPADRTAARLKRVREASRSVLERSGQSALQPLGVNAELWKFVKEKGELLDEFAGGHQASARDRRLQADQLKSFLSATMTEVRAKAGRSLLRSLWTRPGLLHYASFFDHLAELEHKQSFFGAYRDHVNHQIFVFLLGAYMYYNDSRLRDALLQEIETTNKTYAANLRNDNREFLFRWKMAATFHDVGYIFEVSPSDGNSADVVKQSVAFIQKWIDDFLIQYLTHFKVTGPAAAVQRIKNDLPEYGKPVKLITDVFDLVYADRGEAFAMTSGLLPANLGSALLEKYFRLCSTVDPNADPKKKRKSFYDHGIMSAAVLLKTADVQYQNLTSLRRLADSGKLNPEPELRDLLRKEETDKDLQASRFFVRFAHAAGAIALHNVYPTLYDAKTHSSYGLQGAFGSDQNDPGHFRLTLKTPLAYLMALADGLQDWDRHSFRPPSVADTTDDTPLSSHEILLAYDAGKLKGVGLSPQARNRFRERLTEMKVTMADLDTMVAEESAIQ